MHVSVLIPVRDDASGLAITLASLRAQDWNWEQVEVIVCNDGGSEAISRTVAKFGFQELTLPAPGGSYAARNLGLRHCRGDAIAFIDADETVTANWLENGTACLRKFDYVGGRIDVANEGDASFWKRVDQAFAFPVERYLHGMHFAPTANLFVRRAVFEAVGPFDERLASGGDREFGVRVHRAGLSQGYCSDAVAFHPARNFRQQASKAWRVAGGIARLEGTIWRASKARVIARSLNGALHSAFRLASHTLSTLVFRRHQSLAAGRSMIDIIFNVSLALRTCTLLLESGRPAIDRSLKEAGN